MRPPPPPGGHRSATTSEGSSRAASNDPRRPLHPIYTAPASVAEAENEDAPDLSDRGRFGKMEHETRFELDAYPRRDPHVGKANQG